MIHPCPAPTERPRLLAVLHGGSLDQEASLPGQLQAASSLLSVDLLLLEPFTGEAVAVLEGLLAPHGRVFQAPASLSSNSPDGQQYLEAAHTEVLEEHLRHHSYDALLLGTLPLAYLWRAASAPRSALIALDAMPFSQNASEHQDGQLLGQASLILVSHFQAYTRLAGLFPGRVLFTPPVVPNAPRAAVSKAAERIILSGTQSRGDVDGLRWFLTQIWPCFRRSDVELHIAGSVGKALGRQHPNVVLRGDHTDPQAFLRSAHIAIEPTYHGGVPPARLARYLGNGIPSVLTPEAAKALPGGAGEAYLLATSRTAFIDHLARLIEDRALRQQLSEAASRFSHSHFTAATPYHAVAATLRLPPASTAKDPAR